MGRGVIPEAVSLITKGEAASVHVWRVPVAYVISVFVLGVVGTIALVAMVVLGDGGSNRGGRYGSLIGLSILLCVVALKARPGRVHRWPVPWLAPRWWFAVAIAWVGTGIWAIADVLAVIGDSAIAGITWWQGLVLFGTMFLSGVLAVIGTILYGLPVLFTICSEADGPAPAAPQRGLLPLVLIVLPLVVCAGGAEIFDRSRGWVGEEWSDGVARVEAIVDAGVQPRLDTIAAGSGAGAYWDDAVVACADGSWIAYATYHFRILGSYPHDVVVLRGSDGRMGSLYKPERLERELEAPQPATLDDAWERLSPRSAGEWDW